MRSSEHLQDPASIVPLKPDLFHILLALNKEPLHGYGIMMAVEKNTDGAIMLDPSPLYRRLKRLLGAGIVVEKAGELGASSGGPERRYYGLTPLGHAVLACEAARVVKLAENRLVRELAGVASGRTR